jgi:hypothetical protein
MAVGERVKERKKEERNILTWKGGPLFMVLNSHPLGSLG